MIVLTETATTKVKQLLEAEDQPELSLRVAVRPGGCSGLSYEMFFDSEKAPDDIEQLYGEGVARCRRPCQRRNISRAPRSTSRTASKAPGSRSTTRTRSAPAAAPSRSPERFLLRPTAPLRRARCASGSVQRRRHRSRDRRWRVVASVLRERLGHRLGQGRVRAARASGGCCTVLVDGEPRVACVTPAVRIEGG